MRTLPRRRVLAPLLLLVACAGCYTRVPVARRAQISSARIQLHFDVDPALVEAQAAQLREAASQAHDRTVAAAIEAKLEQRGPEQLGAMLAALIRADLLDRNIGHPVDDAATDADLKLTGTFGLGQAGVQLPWSLTDATGASVAAGVASDTFFTGNVEPFADQILVKLAALDLDRLAGKQPAAAPAAPVAAPGLGEPPASRTDGAKAWAVVIGIEKYREALPVATFAEDDARAFVALAERTLGVPEAHVKLLLGDRAGRADLASALEEWLPRNAREPGGVVYVFFSGHGAPDPESGESYLVPYDADPAYLKSRGYSVKELYALLSRLPGQRSLVFLDSCFSGGGDRSVLAAGTRPLVPVKATGPVAGVISLAASAAKETTGAAPAGGHGLFTHHLLGGLAGAADRDHDGTITLRELADHVVATVSADARLQNREQAPVLTTPRGLDPATLELVVGLAR